MTRRAETSASVSHMLLDQLIAPASSKMNCGTSNLLQCYFSNKIFLHCFIFNFTLLFICNCQLRTESTVEFNPLKMVILFFRFLSKIFSTLYGRHLNILLIQETCYGLRILSVKILKVPKQLTIVTYPISFTLGVFFTVIT